MELSPSWKVASCAVTQGFSNILRNPNVHYRVHKSPTLILILSQIHPVQTTPPHLSKINFNIIHSPTSWSSHWSLSFWLSHQNPICIPSFLRACYMACPSLLPWLVIILGEEHKLWSSSLRSFFPTSCHFIPSRPKQSLQHPALKHPQSLFLLQCHRPSFTLWHFATFRNKLIFYGEKSLAPSHSPNCKTTPFRL
jgi:hypothetical protein